MAGFGSRAVRRLVVRRRRDERGVIAVLLAIVTCFTLIPLAAYAVDIGVQRVARRDVQGVADVVALDLARQLDGRKYSQLQGQMQALANKSVHRNSGAAGRDVTATVQLGTLGVYDPNNPQAYFTPMTSDAGGVPPNAVRVIVSAAVDFALHGGSGGVVRSSIAAASASGCFDVGSFALSLNSANSPLLNSLVGDALNLSALSYNGLATANVTLLGLATELGVGSVDGLLNLKNLSLNDLYLASARALQKQGGSAANVALLNSLATANFSTLPHIKLGDVLALEAGNDAALSSSVNLLDLVSTSAFVANGTNALAVPNLTVGVPGLSSVTATLKVIEGPKRGCGIGNKISTSQITLSLHAVPLNVNILLLAASTTLDINVDVAKAVAQLTNIVCNPNGIDVSLATALSSVSVGLNITLRSFGLPVTGLVANLAVTDAAATKNVQFRIPPDSYTTPKSVGSNAIVPSIAQSDVHLSFGTAASASLLSGVVSSILTPVVNPLIANVNNLLLTPLTQLLGVKLGGADVYAVDHPTCNNPELAG